MAAYGDQLTSGPLASAVGVATRASIVSLSAGSTGGGIPLSSARPHPALCSLHR